ncbi:MAG: recombinase [Ruminococcaceae bacterium]|nr:recombinase [Oscillospiraceae bacterium]
MAVTNSLVKKENNTRLGLTAYLTKDAVKDQINKVVGGKDGQRFISAIISAVNTTPALQECTNQSILSGALLGESLKLSPSPQLGHYYLVPFNDKDKGKVAQFQLGYKGYIQLAIRSGQYKKLNVMAVKEGELEYFDPLNEDIKINLMVDKWDEREAAPTIGYYAFFELTNGFRKAIYWSKGQMESHAMKYSPGYKRDIEKGWNYTFWSKDFDGMAYKTMLRQLISKWGIMSIELQNAFEGDMAVINEDGTKNYVETDDKNIIIEAEATEIHAEPIMETTDAQAALFGN